MQQQLLFFQYNQDNRSVLADISLLPCSYNIFIIPLLQYLYYPAHSISLLSCSYNIFINLLIQYLYYPAHSISLLSRSFNIFINLLIQYPYYPAHTISLLSRSFNIFITLLIQYLYYPAHTISLLPRSYKIFYYPAHTISLPILTYLASIVFVSLDIRLIPLSLANSAGFHPSSYQGSSAKLFLASLSLSSPYLSAILRIHPAPCIVYVHTKASFSCHLL